MDIRGSSIPESQQNLPADPVKPLPARIKWVRRTIRMLHNRGFSWDEVGKICKRSGPWACRVAGGNYRLTQEVVAEMDKLLVPPYSPLWETASELDNLVLRILRGMDVDDIFTGKFFARMCGTTDRSIRHSIRRLRQAGHNIKASMAPPLGYWLEEQNDTKQD